MGGHSHTRNAFGRDQGHKVVTETLAIFLVVTGSQNISGSGHGVTGIFLGAVCIILISDSCHSIHSLALRYFYRITEITQARARKQYDERLQVKMTFVN